VTRPNQAIGKGDNHMLSPRNTVIVCIILAAAASRLLPHPPNFTPIAAMALFSAAHFRDRRVAFFVPLAAMFLSDLVLGLHALIPVIYGSFALIVCIGFWLRRRSTIARIATASLAGSVLFFLVTNFACALPRSLQGLADCYVAGIPFVWNTLLGDSFYNTVLFGGFAVAAQAFPRLREPTPAVA
jgi:hypothetical protein